MKESKFPDFTDSAAAELGNQLLSTPPRLETPMNMVKSEKSPRQILLEEAIKITTKDRNSAYGNPEDNFQNIADYWTKYLRTAGYLPPSMAGLSTMDIVNLMILMKMARLNTNPHHRDSLVDIAGYAACGADCQKR